MLRATEKKGWWATNGPQTVVYNICMGCQYFSIPVVSKLEWPYLCQD